MRISTRLRVRASRQISAVAAMPSRSGITHIHEYDIRSVGPGQVNRFAPGGRLGNDLKVGLGAEHRGEPGTNQFLVVGDQYPHGHNALMPGLLVCVRDSESRTCWADSTSPPYRVTR